MEIDKYIAYQIEKQFPSIYREDGQEMIAFVKAYYEFLENDIAGYYVTGYVITGTSTSNYKYFSEKYSTYTEANQRLLILQQNSSYGGLKIVSTKNQSVYHNRRLLEYNDIDDTFSSMLLFYKNKYLNDLPFDENNIRFAVKHILDLYRRKGSREGLELFFRLFYGINSEVYYPANDILKPSSSKWKVGQYLELFPIDPKILSNIRRLPIYGSISRATAIVDRVTFSLVSNTIVPVIFLSSVRGQFVTFDDIIYNDTSYGKVKGSLGSIAISETNIDEFGVANNFIGETVDVISIVEENSTGYGAKARIKSVSSDVTGQISFSIKFGGFGYTTTNTDIYISDQIVYINNEDNAFLPLERVRQPSTNATGLVIGQDKISVGLLVTSANSFSSSNNLVTLDRSSNIQKSVLFSANKNSSADAIMGKEIENTETVSLVVDIIEDFLNVPLNASNYSTDSNARKLLTGNSPTGSPAISITTSLFKTSTTFGAFEVKTFDIGSIKLLANINPGFNYLNNVFVLARDNIMYRFGLSDQIITFDPTSGISPSVGNIILQNDPEVNGTNRNIKGLIVNRAGNELQVIQLSFKGFSTERPFYIQGESIPVGALFITRDYSVRPLGFNADILGIASFSVGKIKEVEVFDSGIGFIEKGPIYMINRSKIEQAENLYNAALENPNATQPQIDTLYGSLQYYKNLISAKGLASLKGQGKTEGNWVSKTSHLNSKKVLQDSNFYQDFSYQISSELNPLEYAETMKSMVHVAGTKPFYKFSISEDIDMNIDVAVEFVKMTAVPIIITTEDMSSITTETQNGTQPSFEIAGTQYKFIEE